MSHDTSLENEQWRDIPGYEGYYQVSDHGRVRSLDRTAARSDGVMYTYPGRLLKPRTVRAGHLQANLCRNGRCKNAYVHRLVMSAFIGPCPEGMEVCHGDGDPKNNHLKNLRYGTKTENAYDRVRHGNHFRAASDTCIRGHDLKHPNLVSSTFRRRGHRNCLACDRTNSKTYRAPASETQFQKISDRYYEAIMKGAEK